MQILSIESFLFVAWPGIPHQKLCVLWVYWWLCFVCVMHVIVCYMPLETRQHGLFMEFQFQCPSIFSTIHYCFWPQESRLQKNYKLSFFVDCFSILYFFSRHFKSMEKLRKGLWSMIKRLENPVAMDLSLIKIWNQLRLHWEHPAS